MWETTKMGTQGCTRAENFDTGVFWKLGMGGLWQGGSGEMSMEAMYGHEMNQKQDITGTLCAIFSRQVVTPGQYID